MKKIIPLLGAFLLCLNANAQDSEIVKTGYNFGPLPAIAYDADKGFQYGAILNIYNYGDGTLYPNYGSKIYLEASFFTKGSQLYTLMYDNKTLIPGIRWSSALTASVDKAMDFYGFNGYSSWFDQERVAVGKQNKKQWQDPEKYIYTPFYRVSRVQILGKTDFIISSGRPAIISVGSRRARSTARASTRARTTTTSTPTASPRCSKTTGTGV